MAQPAVPGRYIDVDEYLRTEAESDVRHEYVFGQVFALAGASDRHNQIVVNVVAMVRPQIRGTSCRLFANDMMLRVSDRQYFYPDVMLVCDPTDNEPLVRYSPCAVIEVLSPSTASIDEREKAFAYKQISSLKSYVIIQQDVRRIEHHHRIRGDIWGIEDIDAVGTLTLPCPDIRIDVADVYEDVDFDES